MAKNNTPKKTRILLIDGDIFAYHTASACEVPTDWGDDLWTLHADAKVARAQLDNTLLDIAADLNADASIVALGDRVNFRKELMPTYKGNRATTRKPMVLSALKDHLKVAWTTYIYPNIEADDVLGIVATTPQTDEEYIIVTQDKDLRQIPGLHYNPFKADEGIIEVTPEMGRRTHLKQALMGDSTDNYKGCPGIGEVKAERLLDEDCSWNMVVKTFAKAGLGEEEALLQARLAYILQHGDYNHQTEEVKLWEPSR